MFRGIIRVILVTLLAVILIGGAFVGGFGLSRLIFPPALPSSGGAPADWGSSFSVFWQAWNYVHSDFYQTNIDDGALVNGSVSGMVDSLGDPHTLFIDAKRAKIFQSQIQGSFEGIGATVEMREGRLTIVAPIKGSPAEKAGLQADDVILEVDGKVIQNMDVNDAVALIRGPKGSTVTLKIQRAKQTPFTVSIQRDTIVTPAVESKMIPNTTLAYVQLSEFSATAPDDLHNQLQQLLAQNPSGLILDLRGNPGGLLDSAVSITSEFVPANQTVVIVKQKDGTTQQLKTKGGGLALKIPMVVLIDKGSASASEILSAALKDYKRATLVGVTTFGKGSVQSDNTLSDGSELNVTIAHFFSPLNHEINDVGVSPDVEVKITDADIANKSDPQLDKAIQTLQAQTK